LKDGSKGFLDSLALISTVGGELNNDGHNIQHSNYVGTNLVIKCVECLGKVATGFILFNL
jgi:hypothetical protein